MDTFFSVAEMHRFSSVAKAEGKSISFVPTMGFLHEGHASLIREARKRGDVCVVSIFVNPAQFGAGEDFQSYPRDLERDSEIAVKNGVDVLFVPGAGEMYPKGFQTYVNVEEISLPLCGASRPGHFRGVATVVTKLFHIVKPDSAFFGEKDYQQLAVIRRLVKDLNMDVEIVGMPTVREPDGLALSSRNAYLSPAERKSALCLSRAISAALELYMSGERSVPLLRNEALRIIGEEPAARVDYVELRDGESLADVDTADDGTVLALAVRIGATRLIDNRMLGRGVVCRETC
ncbi:MAG: pantoate--beta-alanine ligase [Geobacteraceae bacterium]|nr:pantoate--beta-alanine ligase [Geobacteraceae bacterium]